MSRALGPALFQATFVLSLAAAGLAQAKLRTRFAADVSKDLPHPEHPRPQWMRPSWQSLNGPWSYAITSREADAMGASMGTILVPFPIEAELSGVARTLSPKERLWYARSFTLDFAPGRERVLLHFGAVDWEAEVWVNGFPVGEHRGGFDPFTFDVGWALSGEGEQELRVAIWDPTDAGTQPRGKQVREPGGIWYTPSSGIWQTVWLEKVPDVALEDARILPSVLESKVTIQARIQGLREGMRVVATAELNDLPVARVESERRVGERDILLELELPNAQHWSPENPVLYDLELVLERGDQRLDRVESYFGLRTIEVVPDAEGVPRVLLNGEPYFQLGLLDQGFWPDGLYTAPSDEALRYDIEVTKALGFNTARKHVKVEPERWYYWCDRLGLLVWQDMPSGDASIGPADPDLERGAQSSRQFERELAALVAALENHPSIVTWVVFNEGWGQFDAERIARLVAERDPGRLVNATSGWADRRVGDLVDIHAYPGPAAPEGDPRRAAVLGEFGGLGLPLPEHTWRTEANWGYRDFTTRSALTEAYVRLVEDLPSLRAQGLCAAIYTQTSDVETEVNGLMTYDRALVKPDAERVRAANLLALAPPPIVESIAESSERAPVLWRWTSEQPDDTWTLPPFDDNAWKEGPGGFGRPDTPGAKARTPWTTEEIWLRRAFTLDALPTGALALRIHHDEDAEVFLNGTCVAALTGYRTSYAVVRLDSTATATLRVGKNLLAVHCRQTSGGQYIDAGVYALR